MIPVQTMRLVWLRFEACFRGDLWTAVIVRLAEIESEPGLYTFRSIPSSVPRPFMLNSSFSVGSELSTARSSVDWPPLTNSMFIFLSFNLQSVGMIRAHERSIVINRLLVCPKGDSLIGACAMWWKCVRSVIVAPRQETPRNKLPTTAVLTLWSYTISCCIYKLMGAISFSLEVAVCTNNNTWY